MCSLCLQQHVAYPKSLTLLPMASNVPIFYNESFYVVSWTCPRQQVTLQKLPNGVNVHINAVYSIYYHLLYKSHQLSDYLLSRCMDQLHHIISHCY